MKEFDKIIGYEAVKKDLSRVCDTLINPKKYADLGVGKIRNVLLFGDKGVGKTLFATSFIEATKRTSFVFRRNASNEDFYAQLNKTFDDAIKMAPSIILLDDMDKFANGDYHHKDFGEYVAIQSLIDSIRDKDVFVIATANDILSLPESLLRAGRFDKQIYMECPTYEDATLIIKHYLSNKAIAKDIDYNFIARVLNGKSCAEFEMILNEAGIYAGFDNRKEISMQDIKKACMRIMYDAPEDVSKNNKEQLTKLAYHEAGHTIVSELLEPNSVNLVSIRKHNADIGGITSNFNSQPYLFNIRLMENKIISLLAGKASSEIKFGLTDTGATSDIKRAYKIVENFVTNYCVYGFSEFTIGPNASQKLLERKEHAISQELQKYYNIARNIISNNIEFLDKIANNLIEKETLMASEIKEIKDSCKLVSPLKDINMGIR